MFQGALQELRLLQAASTLLIRGCGSAQRPKVRVSGFTRGAWATELRAVLESLVQSPTVLAPW